MKTMSEEPALVGDVQVTLVDDSAEPQEATNASRSKVKKTRRRSSVSVKVSRTTRIPVDQTAALSLHLWMLSNPVRVLLRAGGCQILS